MVLHSNDNPQPASPPILKWTPQDSGTWHASRKIGHSAGEEVLNGVVVMSCQVGFVSKSFVSRQMVVADLWEIRADANQSQSHSRS